MNLDANIDNKRYNKTSDKASNEIEEDLNCYLDDDLFSEMEMKVEVDNDIN
jgi:hypothetical protein